MSRAMSRTEEHVGEWKVSFTVETLEALLAELARVIAGTAGPVSSEVVEWESLRVTARDRETLLVDVANELIGRGEAANVAYGEIDDVTITDRSDRTVTCTARVRGRRVRQWRSPLKAATYHALSLARADGAWRATILFDV